MSSSKSNGGLSSGHFRKGESARRCWVQTLSHLSLINCLPKTVASTATHRDLALAQRLADEKAIAVNSWLEEMEPFDKINAQISSYLFQLDSSVKTVIVSILKRLLSQEENFKYSLMVTSQQQHWREN